MAVPALNIDYIQSAMVLSRFKAKADLYDKAIIDDIDTFQKAQDDGYNYQLFINNRFRSVPQYSSASLDRIASSVLAMIGEAIASNSIINNLLRSYNIIENPFKVNVADNSAVAALYKFQMCNDLIARATSDKSLEIPICKKDDDRKMLVVEKLLNYMSCIHFDPSSASFQEKPNRSYNHVIALFIHANNIASNFGKKSFFGADKAAPHYDKFISELGLHINFMMFDAAISSNSSSEKILSVIYDHIKLQAVFFQSQQNADIKNELDKVMRFFQTFFVEQRVQSAGIVFELRERTIRM